MKTTSSLIALFLLSLALSACPSPQPVPSPLPAISPSPVAVSPLHFTGVTYDGSSDLSSTIQALRSLKHRVSVRVVIDYPTPPSQYSDTVHQLSQVADVMIQPSDSTYSKKISVPQYAALFQASLNAFPEAQIYEICNECNGSWAGENTAAQADAAYDVVKAAGKLALFTPYWNTPNCADSHGDWLTWTQNNISSKVKNGSDYVMPSIYGKDCEGPEPTPSDIQRFTDQLGVMFPHALLGIGEYGSDKSQSDSERVLRYYMTLQISHPRWVFGGYWWYFPQYAVPMTKPLYSVLNDLL